MEARAEAHFEGHLVLRMRRILGKMTTFDDFLTTNDDLGGLRCLGGTVFQNGFRFISTGYRSLRQRDVGLLIR
jgi:hypothetical protein